MNGIVKEINLSLGEDNSCIISEYDFGLKLWELGKTRIKESESAAGVRVLTKEDYKKYRGLLIDLGVLRASKLALGIYQVLGGDHTSDYRKLCLVDPFCYLSHLSAMNYHGLTNRDPEKIFISSLKPKDWKDESEKRMKIDLEDDYEAYIKEGLPKLVKPKLTKIGKRDIHVQESKFWGAYINVGGSPVRVSSIGRTFLDMLRFPLLCGGMSHVMEVYRDKSGAYLDLIIDEVERNGKPVDKVRAGYLLDEYSGLADDRIEKWAEFAQRGGSRKLDASSEYIPEWSDKWKLSLNVF